MNLRLPVFQEKRLQPSVLIWQYEQENLHTTRTQKSQGLCCQSIQGFLVADGDVRSAEQKLTVTAISDLTIGQLRRSKGS